MCTRESVSVSIWVGMFLNSGFVLICICEKWSLYMILMLESLSLLFPFKFLRRIRQVITNWLGTGRAKCGYQLAKESKGIGKQISNCTKKIKNVITQWTLSIDLKYFFHLRKGNILTFIIKPIVLRFWPHICENHKYILFALSRIAHCVKKFRSKWVFRRLC